MSEDGNKSKPARLDVKSLKLVRMYAGELQLKTGQSVSDAKAIFELFKACRPDLVALLESTENTMGQ